MERSLIRLTPFLSILVVSFLPVEVEADEHGHIDRLAVRIQNRARRLSAETFHYRHTPEYRHLVSDTREIARLAKHIHDVTHFEGNLNHLACDISELDQKFHHLERVFNRIELRAAHGMGHVHGNTAHVRRLLNSIEDAIHHLQEDVEIIRHRSALRRHVYKGPRYGSGHGVHWYGRHYGSGFGFSYGGGRSRIRIQF